MSPSLADLQNGDSLSVFLVDLSYVPQRSTMEIGCRFGSRREL